jgi:transporter family-2 protein
LVAIVLGQMVMALLIDHFGILASPKIEVTLTRVLGIALVAFGAFLVGK